MPTELMPHLLAWKSLQARQRLTADVWVDLDLDLELSEAIRRGRNAHGTRMAHGGDGEPKP